MKTRSGTHRAVRRRRGRPPAGGRPFDPRWARDLIWYQLVHLGLTPEQIAAVGRHFARSAQHIRRQVRAVHHQVGGAAPAAWDLAHGRAS